MNGPKKTPHTATHKGKRVRVVLMDGTSFIDRFWDRTKKEVQFKERGWISKLQIKSFTIYKGQEHHAQNERTKRHQNKKRI